MSKWHEDVEKFHKAFNHPVKTMVLGSPDFQHRVAWMLEELSEYYSHDEMVDKIDALIDLAYFIVGTGVAIGYDVPEMAIYQYGHKDLSDVGCQNSKTPDDRVSVIIRKLGHLTSDMTDEEKVLPNLCHMFIQIIAWFNDHTLDPRPFWDIVQHANMSKIWPDGKPHFRDEDGKVIKPKGWEAPEPKLKEEYMAQMDTLVEAVKPKGYKADNKSN